jgi:TatD DNase family protein
MLTDVHCHPFYLARVLPEAEEERRRLGVRCAASAADAEEFAYNSRLSEKVKAEGTAEILPCFAVHPQMPAARTVCEKEIEEGLAALHSFAAGGLLAAVGETGFDLYNAQFRETEAVQDRLFAAHIETALLHDLPVIIHARRAMHKIFAASKSLKKCRAVIFHSWSGTVGEGRSLLRRGINAFFSFGAIIVHNHREAIRCCSLFPADRLLTETDAPYQPASGNFSRHSDLPRIIDRMASIRASSESALNAKELEILGIKHAGE